MSDTPVTDAAIVHGLTRHTPNVFGFKEHDRVEQFVKAESMRALERRVREHAMGEYGDDTLVRLILGP